MINLEIWYFYDYSFMIETGAIDEREQTMTSNLVMTHLNNDDSNYKSDTISYISLAKQIGMIDYFQIIVIVVAWL